ncbi:VTT domain-containing protein, partial [Polymorphospora sp. 2-325]
MHDLLMRLADLPPGLIYVVAAALVMGETALLLGLFVPAEGTLLLVGFLAYTGTLRLGPTLLIMITAAAVGDALAFRAGRRYGPRLRAGGFGARVGEERWARADRMLGRMGGRGIAGARWVAFARTLLPRLAGSTGMRYRRFAPWNLLGVVSWVGGSIVVGYLAGESYAAVSHYLGRATAAVLLMLVSVVAIVLAGRWLGRNPDPVRALLARAGRLPVLRWVVHRYGALFTGLSARVGAGWALVANLAAGLVLLFSGGLVLAWAVSTVVDGSGLSAVDTAIAGWFAGQRTDGAVEVAHTAIGALRGSLLIAVVGMLALAHGWRTRAWRDDLVGVVGTVGAFVPPVLVALVADLTILDESSAGGPLPAALLPGQNAVASASLCTLAWLLSRRARWPVAVAAWTGAAVGVVTVAGARLYVGWSTASETVTSVLLGVLWTAVFMIAWATRDRAVRKPDGATGTGAVGTGAVGIASAGAGPAGSGGPLADGRSAGDTGPVAAGGRADGDRPA